MAAGVGRHVRQNLIAYLALFVALGGTGASAATSIVGADGKVAGCVAKKGRAKGTLRVVAPGSRCKRTETAIAFNQRGVDGAPGAEGAPGDRGATGAPGADGSPDPPSQILDKLKTVDGDGSGLES